ncbi:hypothetical protein HRG84_08250 [Flavisolibacter sp. BT320]|nr:hypothetical protein [Flavisolibacter longurius]
MKYNAGSRLSALKNYSGKTKVETNAAGFPSVGREKAKPKAAASRH